MPSQASARALLCTSKPSSRARDDSLDRLRLDPLLRRRVCGAPPRAHVMEIVTLQFQLSSSSLQQVPINFNIVYCCGHHLRPEVWAQSQGQGVHNRLDASQGLSRA
jgi:hypothetical protein